MCPHHFSASIDNFSSTLAEIERRTLYIKSLRRLAARASALVVEVPRGYAKEAKCTTKQDAHCKVRAEEVAAAAAEEAPKEEATEEEVATEEYAGSKWICGCTWTSTTHGDNTFKNETTFMSVLGCITYMSSI
ncbi:hypothetical protein ACHAWF_002833 [Thalassiosira exigua]